VISFAVAQDLMVAMVDHRLIINADSTQFRVGGDADRHLQVIYSPLKTTPTCDNETITAYFIKYYCIMSAGGYLADPIFVVEILR
jgi:hypothetical protein